MKVDVSVGWGDIIGVGYGVGRVFDNAVYSDIGYKVGEGLEL